jgi:integrase
MPAKRLTDSAVRNVKLPSKDDKPNQLTFIDTLERGLALVCVVSYGGSRTFRCLTYRNGKPHSIKLGTYPSLSVKDARAKAYAYWEDPQKFEAEAASETFKDVGKDWLKRHTKNLHSKRELERILNKYVFPRWGSKRFREIRRGEVNALLDRIEDKHGAAQADAVLAVIRGVMNYYQRRNEEYTSPIVHGMRRHDAKSRDRILSDDEIRAVWKAAGDCECWQFGAIVKLCLLTAQRREKVTSMKWSDIEESVWTVAHEDRQKGVPAALKLPPMARAILDGLPVQRIKSNPYVFAVNGGKHFNSFSQRKEEIAKRLPQDMPNWTIHDLRRTARSLLSRAGVRPDISERVLGHAIGGVEGVYDRHLYADEIGAALEALARLITNILDPLHADNVIPKCG